MTYKRIFKLAFASVLSAGLLSACVSGPTLAPAGPLTVKSAYSVKLDRNWSDVTKIYFSGKAPKVKVLSIDGLSLNRLYISDGLTPADPLMINVAKPDTKANPALRGKADMSLSEHIEFVTQSVAALNYLKVESSSPKPVTLGDAKGVRFEFTANTPEGLHVKGLAQAVSKGGLSYYIVYIAPAEHYYQASLPNVVAVMDSAKLP